MKLHWIDNYQGISHAAQPNRATKLLYSAKFLQHSWAINKIASILANYAIKNIKFDLILAAYCRTSIKCLPVNLSVIVAGKTNSDCITDYFENPWHYNLNNKRVLIIDDVYTSGQTAGNMLKTIYRYSRPHSVDLLVYLKSEPIAVRAV